MSTILIGVDSSARSEHAVAFAGRLACVSAADKLIASTSPAHALHARDHRLAA